MLEKNYNPKDFEEKIYADWENSGDFKPDMSKNKEAFAVVIPPPNVTGVLHMGHALDDTLQDILIRYNRMLGKKVLWQPGMDHAGIATQMVVERNLAKEGITRHDLGREKFVETVWKWKEQSGGTIWQAAAPPGGFLRLEPRAFYHGRGAEPRRPQDFRKPV